MIATHFRPNQGKSNFQLITCTELGGDWECVCEYIKYYLFIYYLLYLSVVITLGIKPRSS